jgi:hypothetical protein
MDRLKKELNKKEIEFVSDSLSMPDRSTDNEDALEIDDKHIER